MVPRPHGRADGGVDERVRARPGAAPERAGGHRHPRGEGRVRRVHDVLHVRVHRLGLPLALCPLALALRALGLLCGRGWGTSGRRLREEREGGHAGRDGREPVRGHHVRMGHAHAHPDSHPHAHPHAHPHDAQRVVHRAHAHRERRRRDVVVRGERVRGRDWERAHGRRRRERDGPRVRRVVMVLLGRRV